MSKTQGVYSLLFAVAGASAVVLMLVYVYPLLFPRIEASRPANLESTTAVAVARGEYGRALRLAGAAARNRPNDPVAVASYGRALLGSGLVAEGVDYLTRAVSLSDELAYPDDGSRMPFYYAPARLVLGRHLFEQGQAAEAVVNFELARPFASLDGEQYAEYHEVLYQAYAQRGLWARALEFRRPDETELDALDVAELELLGRISEGQRDWALAERVANRLAAGGSAEGRYLSGRICFAREQYADAAPHFEQAALGGRAHASFFLGLSLERLGEYRRAVEAYARTPADDLYGPFAAAAAAQLLQRADAGSDGAATADDCLARLELAITRLRQLSQPVSLEEYRRLTPVSFKTSPLYFETGGRFPLLILWRDEQAPLEVEASPALSVSDDALLLKMGGGAILQLQWVENKVNWAGVSVAGAEAPGWIDTARDWFGLRDAYAAAFDNEFGDMRLGIDKMTWFYSVPAAVRPGARLLAAARVRNPHGKAGLRWQALTDGEKVVAENSVSTDANAEWTQQAFSIWFEPVWEHMRLQLEVAPGAGKVSFADVMLVEVAEPEL